MKSLRQLIGGYTIIELMVVLVVGTGIFTLAIAGYNQQNSQTQFSRAVWDLETEIQDVLNDVGTGYYPNSGNFSCSATASGPRIDNLDAEQGKNQECIFIGRALDLTSAQNDFTYEIFTVVGNRNKFGTNQLARSLDDSKNRAITGFDGAVESKNIHGSINITRIVRGDGNIVGPSRAGFAVLTGFGGSSVSGSGATTNQVAIASLSNNAYINGMAPVVNPPNLTENVLTVCIEESGGGPEARHATITIGKGSSLIDVETLVDNWPIGCQ